MGGAAEAVVEAFFVVDREAGRLLIMERTAGLVLAPRLSNLYGSSDQRRKRRSRTQLIKPLWGKRHL